MIERILIFLFSWLVMSIVLAIISSIIMTDWNVFLQILCLWMKPTTIAICARGVAIFGALYVTIQE